MKRAATLLAMGLVALQGAAAPPAGAPGSVACAKALDTLRELEDRVLAAQRDRAEALRRQLLQSRRHAALACLGERGDDVLPRAPGVEAPAAPARPPAAPLPSLRLPSTTTPPRVQPPSTPRTLGACDANGCWTSDGLRLQRLGPQLLGPNGFCSTAGNAVQCP